MLAKFAKIGIALHVLQLTCLLPCAAQIDGRESVLDDNIIQDGGTGGRDGKFSRIRDLMRQAKKENGVIDLNKLIQRNIIDPAPVADFNVSSSGIFTDIRGHFTRVHLHGLKGFKVQKVVVNLIKMKISADMFVPLLSVVGDYALDGTFTFMQISGNGSFWMNLTGVAITAHSTFYAKADGNLEMDDIALHSDVRDIQLHFENLMGGGTWSRISNSLLNQLSELILDELKYSLLQELGKFLKSQFNDHLFRSLPSGFVDPNSANIVDGILKKAADVMVENGLDPLRMPNFTKKYERNMLFVTTRGEVNLTNGYLYGLTSLRRTGDVVAVLENDTISFSADFGFDNLTATYNWNAKMFGVGPSGLLSIHVKSADGFLKLRQDLRNSSKLVLGSFLVNSIRQLWLDVNGMGAWDYIMEIVVNVVTNGLKMQLADEITGPVKALIQKQIDSLNITV